MSMVALEACALGGSSGEATKAGTRMPPDQWELFIPLVAHHIVASSRAVSGSARNMSICKQQGRLYLTNTFCDLSGQADPASRTGPLSEANMRTVFDLCMAVHIQLLLI